MTDFAPELSMVGCSSGVRDPVIILMFGEMNPECACVDKPSQDYFYFGWLALCNVFDLVYDFGPWGGIISVWWFE